MTHADRAREIVNGLCDCGGVCCPDPKEIHALVTAALAEVEREAMERACRLVCRACDYAASRPNLKTANLNGKTLHEPWGDVCLASSIRAAFTEGK